MVLALLISWLAPSARVQRRARCTCCSLQGYNESDRKTWPQLRGVLMRSPRVFCVLSLLATACPDQGVSVHNAAPAAVITSHGDGDQLTAGLETFIGSVDDPDHPETEILVSWLYEGDEVCPVTLADSSGNSSCEIFLDSGDRTVSRRCCTARSRAKAVLLQRVS